MRNSDDMDGARVFVQQKQGRHRARFCFGGDALDYSHESESGGKQGACIAYENLPAADVWTYWRKKGNWALKYLACVFVLCGAFFFVLGLRHSFGNALSIFLVFAGLGLGPWLLGRWLSAPLAFTLIPAGATMVMILRDAQHDAILAELAVRRRDRLRQKNLTVDFLRNRAEEAEKFFRMRVEGVISDQEYDDAIARLHAAG